MKDYSIGVLIASVVFVTPVSAIEVGSDIGVFSQYVWRGIPQGNSAMALQGDLALDTEIGINATVAYSTTGFAAAPQFAPRTPVEFDWSLGYNGSVGDIDYGVGGIYYTYLYDAASNFSEIYGTLSFNALVTPSLTISYINAEPKFNIGFRKGDVWIDLGLVMPVANYNTSLTLSYASYKNNTSRPAADYKSGLSTIVLSASRDLTVGSVTLSPSLLLSIPLVSKNSAGVRLIYGSPAATEFVAGLNFSY